MSSTTNQLSTFCDSISTTFVVLFEKRPVFAFKSKQPLQGLGFLSRVVHCAYYILKRAQIALYFISKYYNILDFLSQHFHTNFSFCWFSFYFFQKYRRSNQLFWKTDEKIFFVQPAQNLKFFGFGKKTHLSFLQVFYETKSFFASFFKSLQISTLWRIVTF